MNLPEEFKANYWRLLEHLQLHHNDRPFNLLQVLDTLSMDRKSVAARLILHQLYSRHLVAPIMDSPGWPKHIVYLTSEGAEAHQSHALAHA